ncbi:reverse transcriptase domain-containing protein [Tanacetum coccineum]
MADNRTMAQLLQAPTEGYEDAIVIPEINANFELKHGLINLVQNKQFFGHDKEDPHAHIRYFNKITSTMRFPDIPSTSIKLMLFPFSLEGSARIWLEKEPPRSILTWDDLVSKFINQFFPPSKTTNLRNEITRFQQRFDESFYEAWDRFNDLLRACPHHGFSELHQLDTFYNALNANDQDSLNSAAGGNFLDKMPRECLRIIESKSKVRNSRNKAVVAKVSSNSSTPGISPDVAALTTEVSELKNMMKTMLIDKQKAQAPAPVKAVEQSCVTCGGAHSYKNCPATDGNVYRDNIQEYVSQAAAANFNQGNTNSRPPMVSNQIRPPGFPPIQNNQNRFNQNQGNNFNQNRGTNFNQNRGNNFYQGQVYQPPTSQPPVYQAQPYQAPTQQMQGVSKTDFENYVKANDAVLRNMQNQGQGLQNQMTNLTEMLSKFVNSNTASSSNSGSLPSNTITNPKEDLKGITTRSGTAYQGPTIPTSSPKVVERRTEPVDAPVSAPIPNQKPSIPYPSRRNDEKRREKADEQKEKFYEIFKDMSFEISFVDALTLMPKFASTLKALIGNKEKLNEMARTPLNEHYSAVILNKLPEKLGDPGRFLIPCKFSGMDECLALADLGASINLMPFFVWKKLNLPNLNPTCMTLELADRSISRPIDEPFSGSTTIHSDALPIMGEKELSTIPEKDKSSVEDLVPIPSGSKGVSDDICDNDHCDAESLLSQDIPITSPKIDFLFEEFAGEFAPIPPGMDEDKFDEEEVDCYAHDISSDDDSYENIEYIEPDQERLTSVVISDNSNNPLLETPEFKSFHFDLYDDLLFPRPPPEPSDIKNSLIVEIDSPVINNVGEINVEDDDSFTFVIRIFLPFFTYPEVSPLLSSTKNEDTIFDPGIST